MARKRRRRNPPAYLAKATAKLRKEFENHLLYIDDTMSKYGGGRMEFTVIKNLQKAINCLDKVEIIAKHLRM